MRAQDFIFLDFEASSLSPQSWPIEAGAAWLDEKGNACSWSSLIRPAPAWPRSDWADAAENVHGISQQELDHAPEAGRAAQELAGLLAGRTPVADAPVSDQRWLERLFAVRPGLDVPLIRDFNDVADEAFDGLVLDRLYEKLSRQPRPHRAGPDALRMARAFAHAQAISTGQRA